MVAVSLYSLVNTIWVAKLGYRSVAAITVTMPLFIFMVAVAGHGLHLAFVERNCLLSAAFTGELLSSGFNLMFALTEQQIPG